MGDGLISSHASAPFISPAMLSGQADLGKPVRVPFRPSVKFLTENP
jgi:hypothetical protein